MMSIISKATMNARQLCQVGFVFKRMYEINTFKLLNNTECRDQTNPSHLAALCTALYTGIARVDRCVDCRHCVV